MLYIDLLLPTKLCVVCLAELGQYSHTYTEHNQMEETILQVKQCAHHNLHTDNEKPY